MKTKPLPSDRLAKLLGGKRTLELAKRAAMRLHCNQQQNGQHEWAAAGAEGGNIIIYRCQLCGITKKEII